MENKMAKNRKYMPPPPKEIHESDIEWLERVHTALAGIGAIAEANAEGCDVEWLAMDYSCKATLDILSDIINDFKNRIGGENGTIS